jgi:hypothetical protein
MTSTHRIEPGQEYAACAAWPDEICIRIKGNPTPTGRWGVSNVSVVSLAEDGRELRPRTIPVRLLHPDATGPGGKRRKTGYYLVRNADGSAA